MGRDNTRTESHWLPLLASWPRPPQSSTQVFWLAWHHDCLSSWSTELGSTVQHWIGVLKVLFWAAAKPAKAETATKMAEERIVVDGTKYQCLWTEESRRKGGNGSRRGVAR